MHTSPQFWNSINEIRNAIQADRAEMASLLKISTFEYISMEARGTTPSIDKVSFMAERFGITIGLIFQGEVDLEKLVADYRGNMTLLPCRYSYAKLSKARTVSSCLDYIELKYGDSVKKFILDSIQVSHEFFKNPDRGLNLNVLIDICRKLEFLGFKEDDYIKMGNFSYLTNKYNHIGTKLSSYSSVFDLFEDVNENVSKVYEQNFNYRVDRVGFDTIYLHGRPTELSQELHKGKEIGSHYTDMTKMGIISTLPCYQGLRPARVIKTKCVLQGDAVSEYQINL